MKKSALLALGISATVITTAVAATLDVKTGLWEVTSQGEMTGMPPIPAEALAKMTPQQRAQVQQSMAAAMGDASKPRVDRSCITEKTLEHGMDMTNKRENCHQTSSSVTSRAMDISMQCTGGEKSSGTFHLEAVNRESVRGTFHMVATDGKNTMTINRTLSGKWLGSDCGDVKPSEE